MSRQTLVAAGHTLWQAALGSGGVAAACDALTHGGGFSGAEQGVSVAATAVAAAAFSLVKGYVKDHYAVKAEHLAQEVESMAHKKG